MRIFLAFAAMLFFAQPAVSFAATPNEPAYRVVTGQANYPWTAGLTINMEADEAQCRARYGNSWRVKCAAALGKPGNTVKGVKMSPPAKGYWQWTEPASMEFVPENGESIQPDTDYVVDLTGLYHPSFVKLDKKKISMRTRPLSARLVSLNFWVDPSPAARHRLAGAFEFNYPVPENAADIELEAAPQCVFGEPEKVWSQSRDRLNISWPVKKLAPAATQAKVAFRNMGQISIDDGQPRYWTAQKGTGTVFRSNIPGANDLFGIKKVELVPALDENLNRCHELHVETSLYAHPEAVLANLHIWELPEFNSPAGRVPYNWKLAPALSPEILKKSPVLAAVPADTDKTERSQFKFRLSVSSDRYILVHIKSGLLSASGKKLGNSFLDVLKAEPNESRVAFLQPGNILPLSGNGTLDIYATDLDRIVWEVKLVRDPFLALIAESSPTPFASPLSRFSTGMDSFSTSKSGGLVLPAAAPGKAQFAALELAPVIAELSKKDTGGTTPSGLALVVVKGMKAGEEKAQASRLVLATDLGIIVKRGPLGAIDCFAYSLTGGAPAEGAKILILGANGKPVISATADSQGHAAFPSLKGLKRESEPVAAVAELAGMLAWLPLQDLGRELNYSDFATGGAHSTPDGLNTFVFSQRGMYRPGDTLHFGCVARRADFSLLPADMPLYAELLDPRGLKIHERIFKGGEFGIAEISWPISDTALSGRYTLNVLTGKNGENIGSASVRVEEFQPDTLKLKIVAPAPRGWVRLAANKSAQVADSIGFALQNLYGTPAAGHNIRARVETQPAYFDFPDYAGFIFTDSAPFGGNGMKINLPDVKTDADGKASVDLPVETCGVSSAKVLISGEGFDLSGARATAAHASFLVSPMEKMLGYRPLGALGNLSFIPKNSNAELEFIAVDPQLKKSAWNKISFSLANRVFVTSLVSDGNGGFRYDETPADTPIRTWTADIPEEGLKQALDTAAAGEFLLTARDESGRIIARVNYAVAGERLDPPDAPLAGGKMRMRLDRNDYNAGDEISLSVAVPYDGTGLISIEREGVAAFKWFEAKAGESAHTIAIPENFEGKGYVVVAFSRSPKSPAIYMSPLTYAVAPFSANIKKRDMGLCLDAPGSVSPGKDLRVSLSAREPGMAVLFAVDEGILNLTGFNNPRPLNSLLADRALDVDTLQAMDLLMPEHAHISSRLSAFGGGMDGAAFGRRFQNPFKRKNEPPLATWSALMPVGPEPVEVSIPVPDYYSGKMRVMAVGASASGAGGAAREVSAAAPLVLTPALPSAVSPGDIFEGALIIGNSTDRLAEIELELASGSQFEVIDNPRQKISVPAGGEALAPFRIKTLGTPGAAEMIFTAKGENATYSRKGYLSVRPASPLRTSLEGGVAKKSLTIGSKRDVFSQNAKSVATLSALPMPLAAGFAEYLQTYPYGCSEQLISRAFAQTLLRAWPAISGDNKARARLLDATLAALRGRYNGSGISLWPDSDADPLLTIYAADFLLALREAGISAGDDLLALVCDAVEGNCALNDSTLSAARVCAYAIWTLTREGRVTTQLIENLLEAMRERKIAGWQNDITGALIAASQREMHMSKTIPFEITQYSADGWFDEFAQYALHMTIMARYFPEKCGNEARNGFYGAAGMAMAENSYATFSACQGIRALLALAADSAPRVLQASLRCEGNDAAAGQTLAGNGAMLNYTIDQCRKYIIDMPQDSPALFWQIATTGYDRQPARENVSHGIEISRRYLDADGREVASPRQGDVLTVEITARAMESAIPDCVITDLLPGGFEMVLKNGNGHQDLPAGVKFIDRREDRMLVFADLSNNPLIFSYPIRAGNAGIFRTAPISAEAMYDQRLYGHGAGGKMEVLKQ